VSYSDYLENAINDAVCNNTALQVAQSYVKLHIGDPGEAGTSNAAGETTRKAASFGASSAGTATSDADLTWTSYSTAETVSHISLWDNATAGNCLGSGALTASKTLAIGDTFVIPSGSLTFTSA
jgi:hypothetical protein